MEGDLPDDSPDATLAHKRGRPRATITNSALAGSADSELGDECEQLCVKVEAFYSLSEVIEDPAFAKHKKAFKVAICLLLKSNICNGNSSSLSEYLI